MLIVGPSTTSTPFERASRPSAVVSSSMSSGSQVAPIATGHGREVDGLVASKRMPRTPAGPSDITIGRKPIAGSPCSTQAVAPVSSRTFSSRLRRATRTDSSPVTPAALLMNELLGIAGGGSARREGGRTRCGQTIAALGSRLELHEDVNHLWVARRRVHVGVGLVRPARVFRTAEDVPVRAIEERSVGNVGRHDLLELLHNRVEGAGVVGICARVS